MSADLIGLLSGFRSSQAIHVAASLGIPDLLADGPRQSGDLAREAGADPDALYRLLRALAAIGVLAEDDERGFALTPHGETLRSDVPGSLHGWALLIGRPHVWQSWGNLEHSIRTGENSFRALRGTDVWEWRAEQQQVVDTADPVLAAVADRVDIVAGSFFDAVPPGGDAYILKSIVHDWEDEQAIEILRVCRAAMSPEATLLVIERILEPPNEGADGKFSDLNMLVMPGGRERTEGEFAALFERAGLRLAQTAPTAAGLTVIEAIGSEP
jgi:hypothetical protein